MSETSAHDPVPAQDAVLDGGALPDGGALGPMSPAMVSVQDLAAHPGNVREDLDLTQEFVASVAEAGVRVPLLAARDDAGRLRIIEGHRRLAAALQAGRAEVPCVLVCDREGDDAGQFLDMLVANGVLYRRNFTPVEEAAALFAAHEAGASKTRIRKSTGRKAEEVKTALAVGAMSAQTRDAAGELASQLSLDQLALLAEFDGDPDAVSKIVAALRDGYTVEYTAERIRQDRAEAAEHQRLCAELEAAGTPVTVDLPEGAVRLNMLTHGEDDLTPESHVACPGRGVYFPAWNQLHPVHYCTDPAANGHTVRSLLVQPATDGAPGTGDGVPLAPSSDVPPGPARRLVIEGNRAWKAAAEVRKRWLATVLFARRTAPRQAGSFVARELLVMPYPLRSGLAAAPSLELFREVTGQRADRLAEVCDTTAAGRLPLLMLGPIVTAYEQAITEGEGKNTWRTDRYAPCPRREAGCYLAFLASVGYPLSVIEQALADDVPYLGDAHVTPDGTDPAGTDAGSQLSYDGPPGGGEGQPETAGASARDEDPADASPEVA